MSTILEIKSLKKAFGEKVVVNGLSFKVNKGEILGFLGPNGAGKSTTINMITTVLDADGGKVLFEGREVNGDDNDFKKVLGYIPQDIALFNDLTAYENIAFFGSLYGLRGSSLKNRVKKNFRVSWII